MDKPFKIIFYVIFVIIVINFALTFFSNSSLRSVRKDLEKANRTADSALIQLRTAKEIIDSTKSDIVRFRSYIDHIQKNVAASDVQLQIIREKDTKTLKVLKDKLEVLRDEFENDSLPPITEQIP